MTKKLENRVAFITGGNSGIGLATAKLFVEQGAKVIITGLDQKSLGDAKASLGENVFAIEANVTNITQLDNAYQQGVKAFGKIDIVFANAGIAKFAPLQATTEEAFDNVMDINVKGVFFTVQRAIEHLNINASIILSSAFLTYTGLANTSVLSASKAAVSSFGKTFAAELSPLGMRVNTISPGYIATALASRSGLPEEALKSLGQNAINSTPMKRFGTPEEMANIVLFLASDDSSYLTGSDILADGGVVYA
jgi:NAD(P)-dependent dehydrogenase (short-subunit alcohol dehydrogenase family)